VACNVTRASAIGCEVDTSLTKPVTEGPLGSLMVSVNVSSSVSADVLLSVTVMVMDNSPTFSTSGLNSRVAVLFPLFVRMA